MSSYTYIEYDLHHDTYLHHDPSLPPFSVVVDFSVVDIQRSSSSTTTGTKPVLLEVDLIPCCSKDALSKVAWTALSHLGITRVADRLRVLGGVHAAVQGHIEYHRLHPPFAAGRVVRIKACIRRVHHPGFVDHEALALKCAVCLEEIVEHEEETKELTCGHVFHGGCVDQWLQINPHCPLCRSKI